MLKIVVPTVTELHTRSAADNVRLLTYYVSPFAQAVHLQLADLGVIVSSLNGLVTPPACPHSE